MFLIGGNGIVHMVRLDKVKAGAILARTVVTLEGRVLLAEGNIITEEQKQKLRAHGIFEVYIKDDISEGIDIPTVVRREIYNEAEFLIKRIMDNPYMRVSIDSEKIKVIVKKIIDNVLSNKDLVANLSEIRSIDDYTFSHNVSVCILSLIIGVGLGYREEMLQELGVGAILHDIGKVLVSPPLLKKPTQLTLEEFEEIKKHVYYGYEILKKAEGIHPASARIALSHHERLDGSGYPYGLKAVSIPRYSRIVAVCDVYDALTTDRVYRKKLMPHDVIEYINSLTFKHFDKDIVDVFIMSVAHYPVGTGVILNSGEKGLVSRYNAKLPTRPVVRVVINEKGEKLATQKEVDLCKYRSYKIVGTWEF